MGPPECRAVHPRAPDAGETRPCGSRPPSWPPTRRRARGRRRGPATPGGPRSTACASTPGAGARPALRPVADERDGHDFVASARAAPAPPARWSSPRGRRSAPARGARRRARPAPLAGLARRRLPGVVGITGSVGKTTTKDLLAAALAERVRDRRRSQRSFNNELGVPLTLLNAPDDTEVAVVEMGARGTGHIADAVRASPDRPIGVVTTVEMVHTEMFGDLAEVAAAKGELIEALPADGTAVLNADNALVAAMAERTDARVLRFGAGASTSAPIRRRPLGQASARRRPAAALPAELAVGRRADVRLGVRGAHNVANALAAAAAALVVGVPLDAVADGLGRAELSPWRMDLQTAPTGARVLNDAYNAGPTSMAAALRALARSTPSARSRCSG